MSKLIIKMPKLVLKMPKLVLKMPKLVLKMPKLDLPGFYSSGLDQNTEGNQNLVACPELTSI